jgi:hypothetical protein
MKRFRLNLSGIRNSIFYALKPVIPRFVQLSVRRRLAFSKLARNRDVWPILEHSSKKPERWRGWPRRAEFALILTHDVDTAHGQRKCLDLMESERRLGFVSSFNFVPERYSVSAEVRSELESRGFEIGVHGLRHDGKLFKSWKIFQERAERINYYLKEWKSSGFRSPSMLHNLEWLFELDIQYDSSTFDTDPFEPQSDGVGTIFPFRVRREKDSRSYIEMPYTVPQDFTLFVLMRQKDISIWKKKVDWIAANGGMVLVNTHPDYMNFGKGKLGKEEYPSALYEELLQYIAQKYRGRYWHALPRDIAAGLEPLL